MRNRKLLALLTSSAIAALCTAASAQTAPPPTADSVDTVVEIVVTAQKREERLQDVPISIAVVSGNQLTRKNVNEVADLTHSVPSLNASGPFGALSIRGVGSLSFSRSAEGSVGVVIDGVALANTGTNPPQLFDVARVEVLEGPQGTLFGRNSSAGVLNIVTNAPNPSRFEAIAHADVATRHDYTGRAVLNLPIADNAALRIAASYSQAPDTMYNRFDGTSYQVSGESVRSRFLWEATSDVSVNLIGDYSKFDRKGGSPWTVYYSSPGSPLSTRLAACGVVVGPENNEGCTDGGTNSTTESYGFSGQVDGKIHDLTLTSITSYRRLLIDSFASDADSVPINRLNLNASPYDVRNFSQELRVTSPQGGRVQYVGGLYYFSSELISANAQSGFLAADSGVPYKLGQILSIRSKTKSMAAFGQATVNINDDFRLILGGRYGNEDVRAVSTGVVAPGAAAAFASIAGVNAKVSDTYVSYRLGAQYDLSRAVMAYATYNKGYKGPSINDQTGGGTIPAIVEAEVPHASELGLKSTLFSGRLVANVAAFHNKVDNFQTTYFEPTIAKFVFGNAPSLTTQGLSFDLVGRPTRALTVNLGGLFNDAKYGDGYFVACGLGQTLAQGCLNILNGSGAVAGKADNAGGNRLIGAPQWKLNGGAEYTRSLSGGFKGFVTTDIVYTSRVNFGAAYEPLNSNKPATLVGARLGVTSENGSFGISLFVRNLFDVYQPVVRFATPTAAQQRDPVSYSQISGPESRRVIGLSLDGKF
jgi:iron complex outermembrane receptor protein